MAREAKKTKKQRVTIKNNPGPPHTETWHQKQLVQWARQFGWGQFLYHIPNETTGGMAWVTRNRQMGCRKGVPDLCLPVPMQGYHGLYIEMKTEKGRLSREQGHWLEALSTMGYRAECCHGWEEAKRALEDYMNDYGRKEDNDE